LSEYNRANAYTVAWYSFCASFCMTSMVYDGAKRV
jgi:hypothetical protein